MGRATITLVLAVVFALGHQSSGAEAQQRPVPRVGFLCARPGPSSHTEAFERGLREQGYAPGKDIVIEYRFMPPGAADPFPAFTADLVRLGVSAIVIGSPLAIQPARQVTTTTPLIMAQSEDPVGSGIVKSLGRPGTNVTGLSVMAPELSAKQLEILRDILPGFSRAAVLWNPANRAGRIQRQALENAASQLGVKLQFLAMNAEAKDLDKAFSSAVKDRAQGLLVLPDMMFFDHVGELVRLASRHRLPVIYGEREFTEAGGLISYGTNYDDLFRRAAGYVDKVVRGARAADLPIQQPTRFELVINAKTAKSLGVALPRSLLVRADRVID